ncbi:hypothetical protein H4R23_001827 [Coemansia sp. Cherry 401B]|nr:hypothetical protein H4R23_001827 [Coemansia sp. Cherry 401B]
MLGQRFRRLSLHHGYAWYTSARNRTQSAERTESPSVALVPVDSMAMRSQLSSRRRLWTEDEVNELRPLAEMMNTSGQTPRRRDYLKVATKLTGRTVAAIHGKFRAVYLSPKTAKMDHNLRWSAREDDALLTAVTIYDGVNWASIAEYVGTRTPIQCYNRFQVIRMPMTGTNLPQNHWIRVGSADPAESDGSLGDSAASRSAFGDILKQHHKAILIMNNQQDFVAASSVHPEDIQPDERVLMEPFSKDEDELILRMFRLFGSRWVAIARLLNRLKQQPAAGSKLDIPPQLRTDRLVGQRARKLLSGVRQRATGVSPILPKPSPETKRRKDLAARRRWAPEEDQLLHSVMADVLRHDLDRFSWSKVAHRMKSTGRKGIQCRMRWVEISGIHIKRAPFTEDEDRLLWPFAVANCSANPSVYGSMRRTVVRTVNYELTSGESVEMSLGRIIGSKLPNRSFQAVRNRIIRLQRGIEWLRDSVSVEAPLDHFELIHRLANSPITFKSAKPTARNRSGE